MENINECDCNIIHKDAVNKALKSKPEREELERLSEVFKLLGDIIRTQILWVLDKNEMCVCDIANVLNMTKSSISHQLAILRSAGIVNFRRDGREIYYRLDDEHITKLYEIGILHIEHKLKGED